MSYLGTIGCLYQELNCLRDRLKTLEGVMTKEPLSGEFPLVAVINERHVSRIITNKKSEDVVIPVLAHKRYAIVGRLKIGDKPSKGLQVLFSVPDGATFLVNILGADGNGEVKTTTIDDEDSTMDIILQDGMVDFRGFLQTGKIGGNVTIQVKTIVGNRVISVREGSEIHITEL